MNKCMLQGFSYSHKKTSGHFSSNPFESLRKINFQSNNYKTFSNCSVFEQYESTLIHTYVLNKFLTADRFYFFYPAPDVFRGFWGKIRNFVGGGF